MEVMTKNPFETLPKIKNAGEITVDNYLTELPKITSAREKVETAYTYNADWWTAFLSGGYEYVLNGEMTAAEYCAQVQPAMQEALDAANEMKAAAAN